MCPDTVTRGTDNSGFINIATTNQTANILVINKGEWFNQPYLESTYAARDTSVMELTINKEYMLTLPGHFEVVIGIVELINSRLDQMGAQ